MDEFQKWKDELPAFPHKMLDTPLKVVVEFHLEHLRRDTQDGKLTPMAFWVLSRGLLLGAMQGYASVCLLLSSKRTKPLMLQAGILNRAVFETLVNIVALIQNSDRASILEREAYKSLAARYTAFHARFGSEQKWQEYLAFYQKSLEMIAKQFGLTQDEVASPEGIDAFWPTPGILIHGIERRKIAPWVTGTAADVLKTLYHLHYPHQSELAHQRVAAVSAAMLVESPDMQWNPGHGESNLVTMAALLLGCIVAEIQTAAGYPRHPKLAELWMYLRQLDEDVGDLWTLRYESLVAPLEQGA